MSIYTNYKGPLSVLATQNRRLYGNIYQKNYGNFHENKYINNPILQTRTTPPSYLTQPRKVPENFSWQSKELQMRDKDFFRNEEKPSNIPQKESVNPPLVLYSQIGFQNIGNTCFMNTCLQILLHTEYFISKLVKSENKIDYSTPITRAFYKLCQEISASKTSSGYSRPYSYVTPREFLSIFSTKNPAFKGYGQHDSQEFCRILLEDMSFELNKGNKRAPYCELKTDGKRKVDCDNEYDEIFRRREDSIVIDTFYTQTINIFTCECGYQTYSFEKFLDIPLLLPRDSMSKIDLDRIINMHFEEKETIQWGTKCFRCKKKTQQEKELKITRPPEVLILSVQKLTPRFDRSSTMIQFSEEINIDKYIDRECYRGPSCVYQLYGIMNHSGTMSFGHYYAHINVQGKWMEFNDSTVSNCYYLSNPSRYAYVFFYKRK